MERFRLTSKYKSHIIVGKTSENTSRKMVPDNKKKLTNTLPQFSTFKKDKKLNGQLCNKEKNNIYHNQSRGAKVIINERSITQNVNKLPLNLKRKWDLAGKRQKSKDKKAISSFESLATKNDNKRHLKLELSNRKLSKSHEIYPKMTSTPLFKQPVKGFYIEKEIENHFGFLQDSSSESNAINAPINREINSQMIPWRILYGQCLDSQNCALKEININRSSMAHSPKLPTSNHKTTPQEITKHDALENSQVILKIIVPYNFCRWN